MKAGIVPHEYINSRNHGIKIKTTLVRYSVQPEPPQKSPRQKPYILRTQGFCLVISSVVLVEQNTSLGGFYYCNQSSNELKWLDLKIEYQLRSSSNSHQGQTPSCSISCTSIPSLPPLCTFDNINHSRPMKWHLIILKPGIIRTKYLGPFY